MSAASTAAGTMVDERDDGPAEPPADHDPPDPRRATAT